MTNNILRNKINSIFEHPITSSDALEADRKEIEKILLNIHKSNRKDLQTKYHMSVVETDGRYIILFADRASFLGLKDPKFVFKKDPKNNFRQYSDDVWIKEDIDILEGLHLPFLHVKYFHNIPDDEDIINFAFRISSSFQFHKELGKPRFLNSVVDNQSSVINHLIVNNPQVNYRVCMIQKNKSLTFIKSSDVDLKMCVSRSVTWDHKDGVWEYMIPCHKLMTKELLQKIYFNLDIIIE